jgi:predicted PurR-regulated permease PerM
MNSKAQTENFLPPLWIVSLLVLALFGWLVLELKEIFTLLVLGYVVSYVIEPVLKRLEKRSLPRTISIPIVFAAIVLVILLLIFTVVPVLVAQIIELSTRLPQALVSLESRLELLLVQINQLLPVGVFELNSSLIINWLKSLLSPDLLKAVLTAAATALISGYSLTLTVVNLALVPFIVYYLSLDFSALHLRAIRIFPRAYRLKVRELASEINHSLSAFVSGQFTVGAILSVLYALFLGLIGVELWPVLAIIAGFGNIVPYLGTIVGITLSSLLALLSFGDLWHLVLVWLAFIAVQFLEGSFITPKIVGEKVGLSPLSVIIAIVAFGSLLGLLGILLAVPLAAILKVLMRQAHLWALQKVPE